jgi:NYN domain
MTVGPQLLLHYGHDLHSARTRRGCGHSYVVHSERVTDVNIACELLQDAFHDSFDMALLLSADSDLSTALTTTKAIFPGKRIVVAFPPKRSSKNLRSIADGTRTLGGSSWLRASFRSWYPGPTGSC